MKIFFTFLVSFSVTFTAFAQPGTLDKGFDDTGIVITPVSFGRLYSLGQQSDGKLIAAGYTVVNEKEGFTIMRYLVNGQLDKSFANNGTSYLNNEAIIYAITILANGEILAVGALSTDDFQLQLAKYLPDGNLDSSFGINGQVHQVLDGLDGVLPKAVRIQEDGKIVIAGAGNKFDIENGFFQPYLMAARLNADGSLDEGFGNQGYVLSNGRIANSLVIQPDGKIVIGGNSGGGDTKFITVRYLPDGNLDESFGYKGIVRTSFNDSQNDQEYINALALQPDGKILAAGIKDGDLPSGNMGIVRYMSDGNLDESFGTNGLATVKFKSSSEAINMFLESEGKIILTGTTGNFYDTTYYALARLNTNGLIDSSYGTNGLTTTEITGNDFAFCGALQANGKILVGGINNEGTNFILARYNNNIQNTGPIARIKKWIRNHWLYWQNLQPQSSIAYYTIAQSSNATGGFREIARIASSAKNMYSYTLPATTTNPMQTINYYRLNAFNASNNVVASAVISDAVTATALTLYPNPVNDVLHTKGLNASIPYKLNIVNEQGNIVSTTTVNNTAVYNFNVKGLSKGVYYVNITSSGKTILSTTFVKE